MRMTSALAAACLATAAFMTPCARAAAAPLETGGFHPGMSAQEALARLKAHGPALEIKLQQKQIPEFGPGLQTWMIHAETPQERPITHETVILSVSYPPNAPTVMAVSRDTKYVDADRPTAADTVAALRGKYGHEMLSAADRYGAGQYYWGWDEAGQPIGLVQMRACAAFVGLGHMMNEESEVNRPYPIPSNAHVCAKSHLVRATVVSATNPSVVQALEVAITDVGLEIASMARSRDRRLGVDQKDASDELKRASQNRPRL